MNGFAVAHMAIGNAVHFRLMSAQAIALHLNSEQVAYSQDYGELT
jgi:hypothetical protein